MVFCMLFGLIQVLQVKKLSSILCGTVNESLLRGNYCVPQKVSRKSLEFKNAPKNDAQQKMHILQHQIDP